MTAIRNNRKIIRRITSQMFRKNQCEHIWGEPEMIKEESGFEEKVERCQKCNVIHPITIWRT